MEDFSSEARMPPPLPSQEGLDFEDLERDQPTLPKKKNDISVSENPSLQKKNKALDSRALPPPSFKPSKNFLLEESSTSIQPSLPLLPNSPPPLPSSPSPALNEIPLVEFSAYVQQMRNQAKFKKEFDKLITLNAASKSLDPYSKFFNIKKKLESNGITKSAKQNFDFVITCSPTVEYVNSIIHHIWDSCCSLVIIFAHPHDAEPEYYWEGYEELCTGSFTIKITDIDDFNKYFIVRKFIITKISTGEVREITHLQYVHFSGFLPCAVTEFSKFIGHVETIMEDLNTPIFLHFCHDGPGLEGVFCVIYSLKDYISSDPSNGDLATINVLDCVQTLSSQKPKLLRTKDQFEFCYIVIEELINETLIMEPQSPPPLPSFDLPSDLDEIEEEIIIEDGEYSKDTYELDKLVEQMKNYFETSQLEKRRLQEEIANKTSIFEDLRRDYQTLQYEFSLSERAHKDEIQSMFQNIQSLESQNQELRAKNEELKRKLAVRPANTLSIPSDPPSVKKYKTKLESAKTLVNELKTVLFDDQLEDEEIGDSVENLKKANKKLKEELEEEKKRVQLLKVQMNSRMNGQTNIPFVTPPSAPVPNPGQTFTVPIVSPIPQKVNPTSQNQVHGASFGNLQPPTISVTEHKDILSRPSSISPKIPSSSLKRSFPSDLHSKNDNAKAEEFSNFLKTGHPPLSFNKLSPSSENKDFLKKSHSENTFNNKNVSRVSSLENYSLFLPEFPVVEPFASEYLQMVQKQKLAKIEESPTKAKEIIKQNQTTTITHNKKEKKLKNSKSFFTKLKQGFYLLFCLILILLIAFLFFIPDWTSKTLFE